MSSFSRSFSVPALAALVDPRSEAVCWSNCGFSTRFRNNRKEESSHRKGRTQRPEGRISQMKGLQKFTLRNLWIEHRGCSPFSFVPKALCFFRDSAHKKWRWNRRPLSSSSSSSSAVPCDAMFEDENEGRGRARLPGPIRQPADCRSEASKGLHRLRGFVTQSLLRIR